MDNYKIKVNDEAESKEAQELFFELGYSWLCCGKYYNRIGNYTFITAYPDEMLLRMGWGGDTDKELTIPQLQDLVVLKRNDVKDATHRDKRDESIYLTSDKVIYYWQGEWCKSAINKSNDYENYIANSLTPIAQPQDPTLISGAEAKLAWANGVDIQIKNVNCVNWYDLDESKYNLDIFDNVRVDFRLKPQTIKVELELPKPFEPKVGDIYWFLSPFYSTGYDHCTFANDSSDKLHVQYGAYRSEDDVKKAVEQLRKMRGNNS
ncbi:hypothetical protein [Acinetobacter baumannii]|uniref:hypothetical protein n=1 Tax=Acinetobacter baumannii TaxID=470 RepID=UPI00259FCB21|nr:hypothetical protein [Acinetobacter baumannii]EHZ6771472.1 hypothetical protein [Acinetobacter baumannii]EKU8077576.1 hypothetical protein [Acinetobacter baumannii]EKW7263424.1 hypothetical protein [Acinetobacter baumannii]